MRLASKEMSQYLAVSVLKATVLVWLILLGFDLVSAFYNTFSDIGKNGYTMNHGLLSTLYTAPWRAYELLPVVAIIGLLMGLGQLATKSELIAMASVGVSRLQIACGALLPALLLAGTMIVANETVGTYGAKQASVIGSLKGGKFTLAKYSGVWAKDGELYFNARSGVAKGKGAASWLELADVRLYSFGSEGKLLSIIHATSANNQNDHWQLKDVERTRFDTTNIRVERMGSMAWKTNITNESLEATLSNPRNLSMAELRSNMDYLEKNQLDNRQFATAYWGRWFYPFKILVLCLSVLPFAFGSLRSGGFGKSLFLGIIVGVSAILLERLFVNLSDVYRFDVRLAYLLAPISVFGLCWGFLAKRI